MKCNFGIEQEDNSNGINPNPKVRKPSYWKNIRLMENITEQEARAKFSPSPGLRLINYTTGQVIAQGMMV